jgi:hypothetical protein
MPLIQFQERNFAWMEYRMDHDNRLHTFVEMGNIVTDNT